MSNSSFPAAVCLPLWETTAIIIWLLFMKPNEQSQQPFMNVDSALLTIRAFPQLHFQFCITKLLTVQISKNHWFSSATSKSISTGHFWSFLPVSLCKSLQLLNQHGYRWQSCFMPKCEWAETTKISWTQIFSVSTEWWSKGNFQKIWVGTPLLGKTELEHWSCVGFALQRTYVSSPVM